MDDHGREQHSSPPLGGFERSEKSPSGGERSAGGGAEQVPSPNPEVPEKARRRRYKAEYKLRILKEAEKCTKYGELGALLRREGLYSSHLRTWKKQREEGTLQGLAPKKRGRKANPKNPLDDEVQRLRRESERLKLRLQQAETIIDVQKKLAQVLGIPLKTLDMNENEE